MLAAIQMRVLIFHGYLLRGTGSNVYNAELAQALLRAGHDVDLVCQEKHADALEWVDALGRWDQTGALVVEDLARDPRPESRGRCTVFLPPIADLLPVYVQDNYKDFSAKTFDQLDDQELDVLSSQLEEFEHARSHERRELFTCLDALSAELVRRYRDGEASVDGLLAEE